LIQFGHNDQPGKGVERESDAQGAFRDHLRQYVEDARLIGAKPILITSLTRRQWNEKGEIASTLGKYARATRAVANEMNVPVLDLHKLSIAHGNRIGADAYRAYEPVSKEGLVDHTHLNAAGSRVIGRLVISELIRLLPELQTIVDPVRSRISSVVQTEEPANAVSVVENPDSIAIMADGKAMLVYNKQSPPIPEGIDPIYRRSGFLHPVTTPSGQVVTATFPVDHAHQHGIFSAWVKTEYDGRQIDFWNLAGGTGRVEHQRVVSKFSNASGAGFEVDMVHRTASEPIVDILRESWRVSARPTPAAYYCFDIETTQQALTDLPLTVQKYHYGGMALRGPVAWLVDGGQDQKESGSLSSGFLNDLGSDRLAGNHQPARWVSLFGVLEGQDVCISVLSHVDNFRSPQPARLHPTKPYFCFTPCVEEEFIIDREHPFRSHYRYLVTDAKPDAAWLNDQWNQWCGR
jgi:hypothetical protein